MATFKTWFWKFDLPSRNTGKIAVIRGGTAGIRLPGALPRFAEGVEYPTPEPPEITWATDTTIPAGLRIERRRESGHPIWYLHLLGVPTAEAGVRPLTLVYTPTAPTPDITNTPVYRWDMNVTVIDPMTGVVDPPAQPSAPPEDVETYPWQAANALCRSGAKIRRKTWVDRWVTFDGALYWLTVINPVTKATLAKRVVEMTDWSTDEYLAEDWITIPLV